MYWQFTPYIFPVILSTVVSAALACFAWRRRSATGATVFCLLMEAVFESVSDAVIVVDEQNRILDLNSAAQHIAHYTASMAVGQSFIQVFASWPELVERFLNMTDAMIVMREEDALRFFNLRLSPLYQHNGHPAIAGRVVVLSDMTQHMRTERLLLESEGRFRHVFEEAPIGMTVVDLGGLLLQVNKVFCEMLGYCEQELIGRSLSIITHPADVGRDEHLVAQMLKGAITRSKMEKRYLRKDGETLWADLTATFIHDQDGQAIYSLMMFENVIERKRAKLLEEELHLVAYELHDGLAQVAASVHQHLQAFASRYRPHSLQAREELDRALKLAQHSVREARRLIAGLRPAALDDFGLATALRLQVETLRVEGWTMSYGETLGSERLSPAIETTLFGVALEALTNVRKHAHAAKARVTLERHVSKIRLEVQDWGRGFEPFPLCREALLGEHMGLRTMHERVELIGGHLIISSQPDVGTLVTVEVPLQAHDGNREFHEKKFDSRAKETKSAIGDS